MIVLVGLGNPEEKYKNTRHNIGSEVIHYLADAWRATPLRENKKTASRESTVSVQKKKVLLSVPMTYMNDSGAAVQAIKNFYKLEHACIWILHDDLDIEAGKFKIAFNRGDAGNNGIRSISRHLGTQEYYRWRIGIKNSKGTFLGSLRKKFVLSKLNEKDIEKMEKLKQALKESLELALLKNPETAMNKYN